jgi:hypothetical protein
MTQGYDEVTFGGKLLHIKSISKSTVPGTVKQKIGGNLVQHNIPGRTYRDNSFTGQGLIFDTTTAGTTQRKNLEAMYDFTPRVYYDGIDQGTYIMTNLSFTDSGASPLSYSYSVTFLQYQQ